MGDTAARSCLDYVSVGADTSGNVTAGTQINNVGVNGADLFYPALSIDSAGNVFTVFDESSTAALETINVAAIDSGASVLTNVTTLQPSSAVYATACASLVCRWGDYSGAAVDPNHPADVWVVSEDTNGDSTPSCQSSAENCWNTYIGRYTLSGPSITSLTPSSGPVAGGQTVTVSGFDFAPDTAFTFAGSRITPINSLTPESFTFVTPKNATTSGVVVQTQASNSLGSSVPNSASAYTYVGLANYVPLSPFRILDTRAGSPLGPGAIRPLQVTGVGPTPVPTGATAVVLNVTEVNGSAASLLTVYPSGTRPNASNLNFVAHTVIANLVTVTLGPRRARSTSTTPSGTVNVVVDVEGYFEPRSRRATYAGCSIRSRRSASATPGRGRRRRSAALMAPWAWGIDGGQLRGAPVGLPSDGTAGAVVVNLTGVAGTASTYLSLFPTRVEGGAVHRFPRAALDHQPHRRGRCRQTG